MGDAKLEAIKDAVEDLIGFDFDLDIELIDSTRAKIKISVEEKNKMPLDPKIVKARIEENSPKDEADFLAAVKILREESLEIEPRLKEDYKLKEVIKEVKKITGGGIKLEVFEDGGVYTASLEMYEEANKENLPEETIVLNVVEREDLELKKLNDFQRELEAGIEVETRIKPSKRLYVVRKEVEALNKDDLNLNVDGSGASFEVSFAVRTDPRKIDLGVRYMDLAINEKYDEEMEVFQREVSKLAENNKILLDRDKDENIDELILKHVNSIVNKENLKDLIIDGKKVSLVPRENFKEKYEGTRERLERAVVTLVVGADYSDLLAASITEAQDLHDITKVSLTGVELKASDVYTSRLEKERYQREINKAKKILEGNTNPNDVKAAYDRLEDVSKKFKSKLRSGLWGTSKNMLEKFKLIETGKAKLNNNRSALKLENDKKLGFIEGLLQKFFKIKGIANGENMAKEIAGIISGNKSDIEKLDAVLGVLESNKALTSDAKEELYNFIKIILGLKTENLKDLSEEQQQALKAVLKYIATIEDKEDWAKRKDGLKKGEFGEKGIDTTSPILEVIEPGDITSIYKNESTKELIDLTITEKDKEITGRGQSPTLDFIKDLGDIFTGSMSPSNITDAIKDIIASILGVDSIDNIKDINIKEIIKNLPDLLKPEKIMDIINDIVKIIGKNITEPIEKTIEAVGNYLRGLGLKVNDSVVGNIIRLLENRDEVIKIILGLDFNDEIPGLTSYSEKEIREYARLLDKREKELLELERNKKFGDIDLEEVKELNNQIDRDREEFENIRFEKQELLKELQKLLAELDPSDDDYSGLQDQINDLQDQLGIEDTGLPNDKDDLLELLDKLEKEKQALDKLREEIGLEVNGAKDLIKEAKGLGFTTELEGLETLVEDWNPKEKNKEELKKYRENLNNGFEELKKLVEDKKEEGLNQENQEKEELIGKILGKIKNLLDENKDDSDFDLEGEIGSIIDGNSSEDLKEYREKLEGKTLKELETINIELNKLIKRVEENKQEEETTGNEVENEVENEDDTDGNGENEVETNVNGEDKEENSVVSPEETKIKQLMDQVNWEK